MTGVGKSVREPPVRHLAQCHRPVRSALDPDRAAAELEVLDVHHGEAAAAWAGPGEGVLGVGVAILDVLDRAAAQRQESGQDGRLALKDPAAEAADALP